MGMCYILLHYMTTLERAQELGGRTAGARHTAPQSLSAHAGLLQLGHLLDIFHSNSLQGGVMKAVNVMAYGVIALFYSSLN